ncbi:MAG: hypothetical protein F6K63_16740 [Moorea sp. SIO1G6]|nr:hypothetical protein [Moorena sp. SIO1G6]
MGRSKLSKDVSEEKQVSYKLFLPESLRAKFKSMCALKGVTMNHILLELIEEWIEENKAASSPKQKKS